MTRCQVYGRWTILLNVRHVFKDWTMIPQRTLETNSSTNTGNWMQTLCAHNDFLNNFILFTLSFPSFSRSRSQAPAWERDYNQSSALRQKNMEAEAGASGTGAFPSRSLGTRDANRPERYVAEFAKNRQFC